MIVCMEEVVWGFCVEGFEGFSVGRHSIFG